MRFQIERHLLPLLHKAPKDKHLLAATAISEIITPPEFNPYDYVSFLVHIDAEIEHALMVQYLYSAYSLGGAQVPEEHQATVSKWQEIILGIAKEEMAHLISAQNVLRLIGAPLNLSREDYPWDSPFYPFPFKLEPLTFNSLAKYIYCESPEDWSGPEAEEIKRRVHAQDKTPHRVGTLFTLLIGLLENPDYLPDEAFQADTFPFQASWDEWGRGYKGGARGNAKAGSPEGTPNLLVVPLATRDDAVSALKLIAQQGEACADDSQELSHFQRFLDIYREMKTLGVYDEEAPDSGGWKAARPAAVNPYVPPKPENEQDDNYSEERDPITNKEAQLWAHLFNVRYRLMLQYLQHSFELAAGLNSVGNFTPRGLIINSTFGEMYNMRAISNFLVQTPLSQTCLEADKVAGPPFLMPYTLSLPLGEINRWRQHKDLLQASETLIRQLLAISQSQRHGYLNALKEADQSLLASIDSIMRDSAVRARI